MFFATVDLALITIESQRRDTPKVLIVGLVRDCEETFQKEYKRLLKACSSLQVLNAFFVESDSSDNSVELLQTLSNDISGLQFESYGSLEMKIPHRIERIRFCRNRYVDFIRNNYREDEIDFVIVADMDGINSAIRKFAINSCLDNNNWDGLFSNQLFGISDLLALRAENWVQGDYLHELEQSRIQMRLMPESNKWSWRIVQFLRYDKTRKTIIYDRMKCIGMGRKLIPVNSAFGGIGIYKSWCFFSADYSNEGPIQECEHVSFHRHLQLLGAKFYLNPRFVNSIANTYNVNKLFLIRNLRIWRWNRMKRKP
jgi:hypothetical protein